ncbi:MAG: YbhB/YbcL family Raf kinase inhibitor-like protein, partial [Candidatus Eremiobacteraeota bacterium]|nr:YbhB/YbcL family Raf kinase inhibitor-like protein [Candidatus Eremiobacteraeota bacterium]
MRVVLFGLACIMVTSVSASAMTIASATFNANATLPMSAVFNGMGCVGQNRSPELHWNGAPAKTKSLVLIVHDPDAPVPGGF